jgi:hypothetical protein
MKQNQVMKWISFNLLAAVISAPMLSSGAHAGTINGRGSPCSDRLCRGINSPNYGKWTCTSLKQACLQKHAGSPQCQVRHTNCMRSGTWTGERGTINYVSTR